MPVPILTTADSVRCPHGGTVVLTTSNILARVDRAPILLVTDMHAVERCPFQIPFGTGTKPQPCVIVRWSAGATRARVGNIPALLQTSLGTCYSIEQIPQGFALVARVQQKAKAI